MGLEKAHDRFRSLLIFTRRSVIRLRQGFGGYPPGPTSKIHMRLCVGG